ncbi:hypothetical protein [Bacillus sp. V3B]|nr:hypothetical protein [Bacillus sp. V3B]
MDSMRDISVHTVERIQNIAVASEEQSATLEEIAAAVSECRFT